MNNEIKINRCPVCNSEAEYRKSGGAHYVRCTNDEECGIEGPHYSLRELAIRHWNGLSIIKARYERVR